MIETSLPLISHAQPQTEYDAAIIGGGLAGLIAATRIAQQGRSVVLFEQAKHFGGRAATTSLEGVHFNLGPHALYLKGHACRLLNELEISFHGAPPNPGIPLAYYRGQEYRLPSTLVSLLTSQLLSIRGKWKFARFLRQLPSISTTGFNHTSIQAWVLDRFGEGALAQLLFAYFRLTSYATDLNHYAAGDAIDQLRLGLEGNVWYVDDGWQALIDALRLKAQGSGVQVHSSCHVSTVVTTDRAFRVATRSGTEVLAKTTVLAVSPENVRSLFNLPLEHPLVSWARRQKPIRAACLDVALRRLTRPRNRFALGLDQSTYFSVHSSAARLGPDGVAVAHVMKYLAPDQETTSEALSNELETLLDCVQPGWREHVLAQRKLPSMIVAHCLPDLRDNGLQGRPATKLSGYAGVYLAGDWVGPRGQLADAAAASAEDAAQSVLDRLSDTSTRVLEYV